MKDNVKSAAIKVCEIVRHSKTWGAGWILTGDRDGMLEAFREYEIAVQAERRGREGE